MRCKRGLQGRGFSCPSSVVLVHSNGMPNVATRSTLCKTKKADTESPAFICLIAQRGEQWDTVAFQIACKCRIVVWQVRSEDPAGIRTSGPANPVWTHSFSREPIWGVSAADLCDVTCLCQASSLPVSLSCGLERVDNLRATKRGCSKPHSRPRCRYLWQTGDSLPWRDQNNQRTSNTL